MAETRTIGCKLVDEQGAIIQHWVGTWTNWEFPKSILLPNGDSVCAPQVGDTYGKWSLLPIEMEKPPVSAADVNAERDARVSGDFAFNGKLFQFRESDRENINGAGTLAALAIMGGAQPGDYLWHGGKDPFVWITSDNSLMQLDAFDTVNLGKAAAAWKSAHIFAARALKDQSPIPEDFTDNKYWPAKAELA